MKEWVLLGLPRKTRKSQLRLSAAAGAYLNYTMLTAVPRSCRLCWAATAAAAGARPTAQQPSPLAASAITGPASFGSSWDPGIQGSSHLPSHRGLVPAPLPWSFARSCPARGLANAPACKR